MNCKWKDNKYTLEECKKEFYDKFPNFSLKIIELLPQYYILIQNNYGICKISKSNLFKGKSPSIQSAINKTEYFINQAKEVHGNKYDYSLVEYKDIYTKVKIICPVHGEFFQIPVGHLTGRNCIKCGDLKRGKHNKLTTFSFIEKVNIIHSYKYDYQLVKYIKNSIKIKILCPIHNEFEQLPMCHMRGYGCPKCANSLKSKYHSENPTGWTKTNWWKIAEKSKEYDNFKVYIIRCWNEEEEFYKIGRTFRKVKKRFKIKSEMPYNYKIEQLFEFQELTKENSIRCFNLETELKNTNKQNKYMPNIFFKGNKECFNKLKMEQITLTVKSL